MSTGEARAQLVDFSRRLVADGLCIGTAGNLSIKVDDEVVITPSSIDADELAPGDMSVVGPDGELREAPRRPSSELPLHLAVYASTGAGAVVHTHSPFATTLSTVVDELPAIHYTINGLGGPVRVAPYTTFGTSDLADNVKVALDGRTGTIIANHGTVTFGATLAEAYSRAVLLEWLAALYWRARQLGEPRILTAEQLASVREQAKRLRYAFEAQP